MDGRKCVRVGQKLNLMLNVFLLFLFTIITFTFQPILILCQGDLFLYGSETMICPIKRKGSWVGCLGWQRGRVRTFFLFNPFPLFQIKVEPLNSYFSIIQRKKGTFRNQWQSLYSSLRGFDLWAKQNQGAAPQALKSFTASQAKHLQLDTQT